MISSIQHNVKCCFEQDAPVAPLNPVFDFQQLQQLKIEDDLNENETKRPKKDGEPEFFYFMTLLVLIITYNNL